MKKKFKVKCVDLETAGVHVAIINKEDARDMDLDPLDRIEITSNGKESTAILDLTDTFVEKGEIGLFEEIWQKVGVESGHTVEVEPKEKPKSVKSIKKKLNGGTLTDKEIDQLVADLMDHQLSEVELTAFITAVFTRGLGERETVALTKAIVHSGETLNLKSKEVFDKHCIGGVVGNKTTMLVVPIIASYGLTIPKTSSRAITSPAGTADAMEVLAPVSLKKKQIEDVVNKTGGCIVWGGAVNLAAADDKLIRIRHPLSLDPRGMLLASILAKKKAVGATQVIIDIPIGEGAKIETREEAEELAHHFTTIGKDLGMTVHSLLTNGDHPIGQAVGPAIEAREVMRILHGENVSPELKEKACQLAGILLELGGAAKEGKGRDKAVDAVDSSKALKKMDEIIKAQGGTPVEPSKIALGSYTKVVKAEQDGRIDHINNKGVSSVVRGAGAPSSKKAGMYLEVEEGDRVKKGDVLFTLYANSERKIKQGIEAYNHHKPIKYGKIILEEVG